LVPRILVADDNSNIHRTVALALKESGVEVVAVGNGEAAVRKVAEVKPDLVLADIFMPVRNGYEVCEFVKQDPRFSRVPVVLLIGAFDPFDEREAQRVRADAVLKKPFVPPDSLLRTVSDLLAQSASRSAPAAAGAGQTDKPSSPASEAPVPEYPEYMDQEPEELQPAKPRLEWNSSEQPLAFGTLLETSPSTTETDDSVMTSPRDPHLGEPAFWAPKDQAEEQQTETDAEGAPAEPSTGPQQTWRPGAELDNFPAPSEAVAEETQTEPLLELTETLPELPEIVLPANQSSQAPSGHVQDTSPELPEIPSFELEPPEEPAPLTNLDSSLGLPALETDSPGKTPEQQEEPLPELKDFPWAIPAYQAEQIAPEETPPAVNDSATETEDNSAEEAAPAMATLAPFLASLTSEASAREKDAQHPFDLAPVPELSDHSQSNTVELQSSEPFDIPAASQLDSAVIEAIAQRVIERMQPKIIELVTRELLRPAVEALVQRELEKQ
jgi:CheY-like chemotaxis protein